jgi:uncharacterized protein YceK
MKKLLLILAICTLTGCGSIVGEYHTYYEEKYGSAETARLYGPYKCYHCGQRFKDHEKLAKHKEKHK